jgi:predicted nucleic-acid-binding Zn-ribbon protein
MPKIFLQAVIRNNDTYRIIIDGQQRVKAMLDFLRGGYALEKPYTGEFLGFTFDKLPPNIQEEFLSYKIDVNEIRNAPDDVVRDIYSRVNKYTVALNRQELRRADYPGEFLSLSEELATELFFEEGRVFTPANSKRMQDVEFVSELLALLIKGPQDKRDTLDQFYAEYQEWDTTQKDTIKARFMAVIADLQIIFESNILDFSKTRFRQKADFYSIFAAIDDLRSGGFNLDGKTLDLLRADLRTIDLNTAPESRIDLFRHYAVQCVSQANSSSSRTWRRNFLKNFLQGTYCQKPPGTEAIKEFHSILSDLSGPEDVCPAGEVECPVCGKLIKGFSEKEVFLTWGKGEVVFQLENAIFIHTTCRAAAAELFLINLIPESGTEELPLGQ